MKSKKLKVFNSRIEFTNWLSLKLLINNVKSRDPIGSENSKRILVVLTHDIKMQKYKTFPLPNFIILFI